MDVRYRVEVGVGRRRWVAVAVVLVGALQGLLLAETAPKAAHAAATPWYMKATEMTPEGRLTFLEQPWWPRAQALKEGESFTLDLSGDGRPDTKIVRLDGNIVEAIDDSDKAADIWNEADTAYVVSYKGTGIVDRMVVYTDNNADSKADEMEIRYYRDGYLRYAWFGENYDNDGVKMIHTTNWQYDANQFQSKFRGNSMIYLNKYDPRTRSWVPLSECPFAFYDPNHDGLGEMVIRSAVQTEAAARGTDLDRGNNLEVAWQQEPIGLDELRQANVRLSYNIDPEPRHDALEKPHYNFGFTMLGDSVYRWPGMYYRNPKRRAPQTVVRVDWKSLPAEALGYRADMTGFSWDEARTVYRWEGQFWIYERRIIANTGGPLERWNMRREYSGAKASSRKMYYSGIDRRYHMKGASEMWLEVGHVVSGDKDMEVRAYDTDGDGYLDRWEVFREGTASPVRVTQVKDPKARMVALDRTLLRDEYNGKVLPEAITANEQLIVEMKKVASSELAAKYEVAANQSEMLERKRYLLDVARELYFVAARDALYANNGKGAYPKLAQQAGKRTMDAGPVDGRFTMGDTTRYWGHEGLIEQFVRDYGEGDLVGAAKAIEELNR